MEVGDTVTVLLKPPNQLKSPYWHSDMDKYLGKTGRIQGLSYHHGWLQIQFGDNMNSLRWWFHPDWVTSEPALSNEELVIKKIKELNTKFKNRKETTQCA